MYVAFLKCQRGGSTSDWVTMTAVIVLLGLALVQGLYSGGVPAVLQAINEVLEKSSTTTSTGSLDRAVSPLNNGVLN